MKGVPIDWPATYINLPTLALATEAGCALYVTGTMGPDGTNLISVHQSRDDAKAYIMSTIVTGASIFKLSMNSTGFVGKDGKRLLCSQHRDTATDIARKALQLFYRNQFCLAVTSCRS